MQDLMRYQRQVLDCSVLIPLSFICWCNAQHGEAVTLGLQSATLTRIGACFVFLSLSLDLLSFFYYHKFKLTQKCSFSLSCILLSMKDYLYMLEVQSVCRRQIRNNKDFCPFPLESVFLKCTC